MTSATYGAAPKTNDSVMVNKPSKVHGIIHGILVVIVIGCFVGNSVLVASSYCRKTQAEAIVPKHEFAK